MAQHVDRNTTFREIAGIITAMIVVLLFAGLGVIQVAVFVITGQSINFDPDYKTALLGLASMALGFLVGSQSDNKVTAPRNVTAGTLTNNFPGYAAPQGAAISEPPNEGSSGTKPQQGN